jgi:hypothetical protein
VPSTTLSISSVADVGQHAQQHVPPARRAGHSIRGAVAALALRAARSRSVGTNKEDPKPKPKAQHNTFANTYNTQHAQRPRTADDTRYPHGHHNAVTTSKCKHEVEGQVGERHGARAPNSRSFVISDIRRREHAFGAPDTKEQKWAHETQSNDCIEYGQNWTPKLKPRPEAENTARVGKMRVHTKCHCVRLGKAPCCKQGRTLKVRLWQDPPYSHLCPGCAVEAGHIVWLVIKAIRGAWLHY